MWEFLIFAATFVIFLICGVIYLYPGSKKLTTIPGPEPVDTLEGNASDIAACGSLHEFLEDIHSQYGSVTSFWLGSQLVVSVSTAELFEDQKHVFDRPVELFQVYEALLGTDGLKFCNGGEGRKRRMPCCEALSVNAVKKMHNMLLMHSEDFVGKWSSLPPNEHLPLMEFMLAFSLRSFLRVTCGDYFDDGKLVVKLRQSFDVVFSELEAQMTSSVAEATSRNQDLLEQHKKIIFETIRKAMDHRKNNKPEDGEKLVIDYMLSALHDSPARMLADMSTVIVEGFHTSGLLSTWAIYYLASHPDVQKKLHKEVVEVCGEGKINSENIDQLTYLQQVLNETLRVSSLIPYTARVQNVEIELGGHKVPPGTPVVHALGVALNDKKVWSQPEKFDPERFSPENMKNIPDLAFQPFGFAGKRQCPGNILAMTISSILICNVVRQFVVKTVEGQVVSKEYTFVTKPRDEIWVTLEKRK